MTTNEQNIKRANKLGLDHKDSGLFYCWYTPILQVAYSFGSNGISLQACNTVSGYRYGNLPDSGLSYNYTDDRSERGLSLASLDGGKEIGSSIWFADRPITTATGLELPHKGSDGEPLILPYGFEIFD